MSFRVVLVCETPSYEWYAQMEDYYGMQVTSRRGPWASGIEAATEFFREVGAAPVSIPAWVLDEYVGG